MGRQQERPDPGRVGEPLAQPAEDVAPRASTCREQRVERRVGEEVGERGVLGGRQRTDVEEAFWRRCRDPRRPRTTDPGDDPDPERRPR
ncbi:hypothetical protein ACFQV8_34425 [Pseudonocardia benzenivorans]